MSKNVVHGARLFEKTPVPCEGRDHVSEGQSRYARLANIKSVMNEFKQWSGTCDVVREGDETYLYPRDLVLQ